MAHPTRRFPSPTAARRGAPKSGALRRGAVGACVAIAMGAMLGGCASVSPTAWRIEGNTRIAHGSVDSAAAGYLALARRYDGEHRGALAADAYRKAVRESPTSVDVLHASALGLAAQGDLVTAVALLQRAVELRPDQAPIANNLGYALMLAGRDAEAAAALQRALTLAPTYRAAQLNWEQLEQRQLAMRASPGGTHPATPGDASVAVAVAVPLVQPVADRDAVMTAGVVRFTPNVGALVVSFASEGERPAVPTLAPVAAAPAVATPAVAAPTSAVRVDVVNGNGVPGLAAHWRHWLQSQGVATGRLSNLLPYDTATTVVQYRPGFQADAQGVAAQLKPGVHTVMDPGLPVNGPLRILIGRDSAHADLS